MFPAEEEDGAGLAGGETSSKMSRRRGLPGLGGGEEPRTKVLELEEGAGAGAVYIGNLEGKVCT